MKYLRATSFGILIKYEFELQTIHKGFLLLEDVLELTQGGLHLLQGELVLTLSRLVLSHPGVELGDGVVQQHPLLDKDLALLDPGVGDSLDLGVSLLQGGNLGVSLSVSGHLEGGALSGGENLKIVDASFVEGKDLVIESLDLAEVGGLGQTFGGGLLSAGEPGGELLNASSVLGPELDIVGVFVALDLGVGLELLDVLDNSGELVLEDLGVSGDLVTLGQEVLLSGGAGLEDLELGGDVLLEVHGPGNSVLREHGAGGLLDVLKLSSGGPM